MIDLTFLKGKAIHSIHNLKDTTEIHASGSVITLTESDDIESLNNIIHSAKKWAVKTQDIYNYIEYLADTGEELW